VLADEARGAPEGVGVAVPVGAVAGGEAAGQLGCGCGVAGGQGVCPV
jgi:hypothetical protein